MILTYIIPFEKYTLTTQLSETDVLDRVADSIIPENKSLLSYIPFVSMMISYDDKGKNYEGYIKNNTFYHRRRYGSPIIKGQVTCNGDQTQVRIFMRQTLPLLFTIAFGYITCISLCLYCAWLAITGENRDMQSFYVPYIMLALFWVIGVLSFKWESNQAKKFLNALLDKNNQE